VKNMAKAIAKRGKAKRIAWGESSDVFLLPKERAVKGGRVLRIERRIGGKPAAEVLRGVGIDARRTSDGFGRYHTMRLAQVLFPEHVIKMTALQSTQVSLGRTKQTAPRFYSKYYPLPKRISTEGKKVREMIRLAHLGKAGRKKVLAAVRAFDKLARKKFPELIPTATKLKKAGFLVPHPELNFTIHKGKIMFYEVRLREMEGFYDPKITAAFIAKIEELPRREARKLLAQGIRTICESEVYGARKRLSGDGWELVSGLVTRAMGKKAITAEEALKILRVFEKLVYKKNQRQDVERLLRSIRLSRD